MHFCAVVATEHAATAFQSVANDAHLAVITAGRDTCYGALEAVERVDFSERHQLKCFVVHVAALIAFAAPPAVSDETGR